MAVTQLGLLGKRLLYHHAARAARAAGMCWGLVLKRYVPVHETPSGGPDGHAT